MINSYFLQEIGENLSPPTYYKNGWPEGLPGRIQLEKVIVIYHHPKGSTTFFLNRGNAFLGGCEIQQTSSQSMILRYILFVVHLMMGKGQSSEPSLRCLGFRSLDFCLLLKVYMYIYRRWTTMYTLEVNHHFYNDKTNPYVIKHSETRRSPTHKKWWPVGLPGCTQKTPTSFSLSHSRLCAGHRWYATCAGTRGGCFHNGVGGKMAEDVSNFNHHNATIFHIRLRAVLFFFCKDIVVLEWGRYWKLKIWSCLFAFFRSKRKIKTRWQIMLLFPRNGFSLQQFLLLGGMPSCYSYYHPPDTQDATGVPILKA